MFLMFFSCKPLPATFAVHPWDQYQLRKYLNETLLSPQKGREIGEILLELVCMKQVLNVNFVKVINGYDSQIRAYRVYLCIIYIYMYSPYILTLGIHGSGGWMVRFRKILPTWAPSFILGDNSLHNTPKRPSVWVEKISAPKLGGGNSNMLYFSPLPGEMIQFD